MTRSTLRTSTPTQRLSFILCISPLNTSAGSMKPPRGRVHTRALADDGPSNVLSPVKGPSRAAFLIDAEASEAGICLLLCLSARAAESLDSPSTSAPPATDFPGVHANYTSILCHWKRLGIARRPRLRDITPIEKNKSAAMTLESPCIDEVLRRGS